MGVLHRSRQITHVERLVHHAAGATFECAFDEVRRDLPTAR